MSSTSEARPASPDTVTVLAPPEAYALIVRAGTGRPFDETRIVGSVDECPEGDEPGTAYLVEWDEKIGFHFVRKCLPTPPTPHGPRQTPSS